MRKPLADLLHDKYPAVAKDLVGPLLEVLRLSREHFGGDVDRFMILLAVAVRTAEHPDFATFSPNDLLTGEPVRLPSLGVNMSSIAASIGIPKETVRRKIVDLVESGWLRRDGGNLAYTVHGYRQMAPLRDAIERLAVRFYEVVAALHPAPPP